MNAAPMSLGSWDLVQSCERAGVRISWMRRRHGDGPSHIIRLQPLDPGELGEELGPYERADAALAYDAAQASLLVAARQQRARLRGIMERRSGAASILAARRRV